MATWSGTKIDWIYMDEASGVLPEMWSEIPSWHRIKQDTTLRSFDYNPQGMIVPPMKVSAPIEVLSNQFYPDATVEIWRADSGFGFYFRVRDRKSATHPDSLVVTSRARALHEKLVTALKQADRDEAERADFEAEMLELQELERLIEIKKVELAQQREEQDRRVREIPNYGRF